MASISVGDEKSVIPSGAILNSLTSGILAIDLNGHVIFINTALAERLHVDVKQSVGILAAKLFDSVSEGTPVQQAPMYRIGSRRTVRTYSREVQWIDGSRVVHVREDSAPLLNDSGEVIGRLFAYHDLSWEKTIDQMKSEFISIASHELRTPMTSIKGSVDLILGGCAGDVSTEALELLGVARSACDRMIRLINNILDLSKIEAGQIKLQLEPLNLVTAVNQALRSLKHLAAQDQISIEVAGPSDCPCVEADSDRIEQIITNLVSNAIKFSPASGIIRIEISADDKWVTCGVSDQGCGIKEEDLDRIFGKFQQAGLPQRGKGTGLGLAITHALVTEHKGKIWAESRVGEGSRFVFRLPISMRDASHKSQ